MSDTQTRNRATSDPAARKDVLQRMRQDNVEFLLLWFTDIEGHLKSFAITPQRDGGRPRRRHGLRRLLDHRLQRDRGIRHGRDPRSAPHYQLMPAHAGDAKVARMICDVVTPDGNPYDGDPRHVLRRALERMEKMGFDTFNVGPELEYFLFKDSSGTETLDEGGYFAMTTMDAATELRNRTIAALEGVGDPRSSTHHHEVGPVAARDRHALRPGARHGRPHDHLPADREGDRGQARGLRDVHAEADLRRERLGHAHPPVAVQGRAATRSSTPRTTGTCPTSARRSSPASCATRARSRRCSRSG